MIHILLRVGHFEVIHFIISFLYQLNILLLNYCGVVFSTKDELCFKQNPLNIGNHLFCFQHTADIHVFLLPDGLQFKGMRNDLQPAVVSLGISSAHIHDEGSYNMIHGSKGRSDINH